MNLYIHILISIITFFTIIPKFSSHSSHPTTIYDALTTNGLPIGILPKGITNFTLDPTTNKFTVTLNKTCNTKFETSVRFDWNFSGVLSYGQVSNLSGIAAQDLFLWFPVKGIHVDVPTSGLIYFDVGVVFKQFALSSFEVPKDCNEFGDGFGVDLVVLKVKDRSENPLKQHVDGDEKKAIA
uniref:uncharacterized protein LOC122588857 n=1 Tax=Erigeron canadensis TaxID=72917 RepID=UPI001CB8C96A|nr:uncharacterized protein LOC122588857 [Erigeron canadensis]